MPFVMVNAVGRGMGVLNGGGNRQRGRGCFGSEFGASHCKQVDLETAVNVHCLCWFVANLFLSCTSDLIAIVESI